MTDAFRRWRTPQPYPDILYQGFYQIVTKNPLLQAACCVFSCVCWSVFVSFHHLFFRTPSFYIRNLWSVSPCLKGIGSIGERSPKIPLLPAGPKTIHIIFVTLKIEDRHMFLFHCGKHNIILPTNSPNGCNHHQEILARAEESPNFNGVAHRLLWRELHRLNAIRSGVRMGWGWGLEGHRISIVANTWTLKFFFAILKGWISIGPFQIFGKIVGNHHLL